MLTSLAPTLLWCATGLPSGADTTDHQLARLGREVGDLSSGMRPAVRPFAGQAGSEGVPGLSVEIYPLDVPTPVVERTDPAINFTWGSAAPATGIPANRFGATWTGEVVPTVSGDYTFIARTDDGVRLYIDGALVIDRWVNQSARDVSSTVVKLKKDKAVTLRMEYYENTGQASARLSWSRDGGAAAVIPQANLRSADLLNAFPPVLTGPISGSGSVQVGAFTPLDGGVIHYTVDGTDPVASSPTVSGGVITLTASANLRAAVRGSDGRFGPVATRTITVLGGGGTGLLATYIGGTNPGATPLLARTDAALNFNWRAAPPAAGLPADYFTARWEGELVPAWSETTTFSLSADDGARVYLGGKLIIDRFHGSGSSSATVALTAGQALPLVVEYVELGGNASVRLRWQSASMSLRDIPTAALRPVVQSVPDAAGRGLAASYFANTALTGTPAAVRVEPRLDWRWGTTAPAGLTAVDGWSARWEGAIIPRFTETYTLSIAADDGVRVWIDGVQKLNDWRSRGHRTLTTTVALTAGRAHAIKVEKSDVSSSAGATLLWSSLSQQREVVPSWRLLPSRPPTVEELALAGAEDSSIAGTAVASDPDGDVLAWSVKTQPGHGSVSVDAATGAVSYVPNLNYNGSDSFVLLVKDAYTETELPVSVAVAPVNDAPVAAAAPAATDEDTAVTVTPSASDVDGDALTWSLDPSAGPAHGQLSVIDASTGAVTYTPAVDWNGSDSFVLVVNDGSVDTRVTVTVAVAPVNDAPVLAGIETALSWFRDGDAGLKATAALTVSDVDSTNLNGATVRIAGNFQPGDELLFTNQNGITGAYAAGTLTLSGSATLAQYQTALRSVTYRSTQAFPGTAARAIAFTVSDGSSSNEAARTLGVVTRSTPPWSEGFEGLAIGGDLHQLELQGLTRWHGWNAAPGASALVSAAQARSGGASVAIAGATDLVKEYKGVNAGGWRYSAWQYIPTTFTGTSYFILLNTYRDTAGTDGKNWSTQVKFTNSQVLPDFAGGSATVVKGQWVELRVDIDFAANLHRFSYNGAQVFERSWTNGTTGGGVLNLAAVDLFANGASPVYYDDISLTPIVPTISGGGSVAYLENAAPVPVMPALAVDGFGVAQLSGATVQLTGDLAQDVLSATVSGGISQSWNPATGTLTLSGNATPAVYQTVLRTVAFANGSEAPSLAPRTVAFAVTAPTGTSNSVSATVTVTPVNDAPVAQALALSGDEDSVLTGQAVASDVDGGALTWSLASQPANGTATVDANSGAVSYQPNADFAGADSFALTVSDGNGSAVTSVSVTVNAVNDAPVAQALILSGDEDTQLAGTAVASDVDGGTLTWSLASQPANGTATVDANTGVVIYQPNQDFAGTDSFGLSVSDGTASAPASVSVTVNAIADLAEVSLVGGTAQEGGTLVLTARRSSPDNTDLVLQLNSIGNLRYGRDLDQIPNSVTIVAGSTEGTVAIAVVDDDIREPQESLQVAAIPSTGVVVVGGPVELVVDADSDPVWLIDNDDAGYAETGTWWDSTVYQGWSGSTARWSSEASARATYTFDLDLTGWFDVGMWVVYDPNSSDQAAVRMTGLHGTWTQHLDLRSGTAGWVSLGKVRMGPGAAAIDITKPGVAGILRADAVRLTPTTAPEAVVTLDRGQQGYRETSGAWWDSILPSPNGGTSRYSTDPGASAVWEPVLAPGLYKISFYCVCDLNSATQVRVGLDHALGTTTTLLNQTTGVSRWVELGTVPILAGQGRVTLQGVSNDGPVRADAVRFEALPTDDITIPTSSISYREVAGAWWTSSGTLGATGNPTRYSSDVATAVARWYAPPADGDYMVMAYRVVNATNGGTAVFSVNDADGTDSLGQLQQKAPAVSGWVELGLIHLAPTDVWPIEVRSLSGSGTPLRTDALRLVRVTLAGPG